MYNSNLNLNLYKTFYDVAQYGSVSTASKYLNISQPAISRSIKKLEDDLNVTLFYRTLNGMVLTEKGKELLSYVEEACNSLKIGERAVMECNNLIKGKLSIGIPSEIASFYLFDKIKRFNDEYPNIEISVYYRCSAELIKLLENHEVDMVIDVSPICGSEKELHIEEIMPINYIFVKLKDNDVKANSLHDLENYQVILPILNSNSRRTLNEVLLENKIKFSKVLSVENSEGVRKAVIEGNGIGYTIENLVKKDIESGIFEKVNIKEKLPSTILNLVYIDKYLMSAPRVFIDKYLKNNI